VKLAGFRPSGRSDWVDPKYPDKHRDPALRHWMARRAEQGIASVVRFNSREALTIFAPPFGDAGEWHEIMATSIEKTTHLPT
jgi:hypothetical protein